MGKAARNRKTHADGGDLAIPLLTARQVASFASIMSIRPRLAEPEIEAVARYVNSVERRRSPGPRGRQKAVEAQVGRVRAR